MPADQFIGGLEEQPKTPTPQSTPSPDIKTLIDTLNRMNGRMRSFERSLSDLRDMIRFQEDRSTKATKDILAKQKTLEEKNHALSDHVDQFQQTLTLAVKELQLTAKKEDVDILRRVLELIKPTQFITQNRALELIQTILEEKGLLNKEKEKTTEEWQSR